MGRKTRKKAKTRNERLFRRRQAEEQKADRRKGHKRKQQHRLQDDERASELFATPRVNTERLLQSFYFAERQNHPRIRRFRELLDLVARERPRMAAEANLHVFWTLTEVPWQRSADQWIPKGRGTRTAMRSLVDHLLVKYPIPGFLYAALLTEEYGRRLNKLKSKFVAHVAAGRSIYQGIKNGLLPVPLTKRMCHLLMGTPPGIAFIPAIRRAQVLGYAGEESLAAALAHSQLGERFMADEHFWATVVHWFCRQDEIDLAQVDPLLDYIAHRRGENQLPSMRGRSIRAMVRGMEEWHQELAVKRKLQGIDFSPSGIAGASWIEKRRDQRGFQVEVDWTIEEILSSKALVEEGRAMRHCVASYALIVKKGEASIWSLRCNGERCLTIEVRNRARVIRQARGKCDRLPNRKEVYFLRRWAAEKQLRVNAYGV